MNIITRGTLAQANTVREGIKLVRGLIKSHDLSQGVSTTDLYKLATEVPAPGGFNGDPRLVDGPGGIKGISLPPNNDHPIRSKSFLKRVVLPALEGSGEMKKVCLFKEITAPVFKTKKGKISKNRVTSESAGASLENPVTVRTWVWRPLTESERSVSEVPGEDKALYTRLPWQREEVSHLNKRRQRSRELKQPEVGHVKTKIDPEAFKRHNQQYDRRKVEERKLHVSC